MKLKNKSLLIFHRKQILYLIIPKKQLWRSVTANGQLIWTNGVFVNDVTGFTGAGEDSNYIRFSVEPGAWKFDESLITATGVGSVQHDNSFV